MTTVVLQITDFYRYAFVNPGQILSYLNAYFAQNMDSMQYCEEIENAFLFLFRDIDAFTYRAKPLEPASLIQIEDDKLEKENFFQSFFVSQSEFPSKGIEIDIRVIEGDLSLVVPLTKKFVKSVNPGVIIHDIDERTMKVYISTYSIIQGYVNSLVRRFYLSTK